MVLWAFCLEHSTYLGVVLGVSASWRLDLFHPTNNIYQGAEAEEVAVGAEARYLASAHGGQH